ncbi:MAG: nitroreductase family protein [Clostridiales bacterium]|nr:nitroreductase family protein [Clostridiales bacterium]
MQNVLDAMRERRSVRAYRAEPVDGVLLDMVLEAGLYAASGKGRQSAEFVLVTDAALMKELSAMNAAVLGRDTDPFYGAPAVIVVFADSDASTWVEDGALALGNLMLATHALGLGSVWVHRARQMFESAEGKALKAAWGLAESLEGIGICALGWPLGEVPDAAERRAGRIHKV